MPGVDLLAQLGATQWTVTDAAKLQHAMQRARFDMMAVVSRRALAGDLAAGNAEVKALLDENSQMRGWVVINPVYPERSAEELRRYAGGAKWVGAMLHPRMCGAHLASGPVREVLNAYRRFTKPLLVDVPDEESVRELEALAAEFNTIKFVAAGAGGDDWQACALAAKRVVNIFPEPFTGGTHRGKVERMVELLGAHRLLMASNYPEQNPGSALGCLVDAKIGDGEKQAILATNAVRMFNLRNEG
jgi:predicted TIM-barrel fold metal-dependent hydrolase